MRLIIYCLKLLKLNKLKVLVKAFIFVNNIIKQIRQSEIKDIHIKYIILVSKYKDDVHYLLLTNLN